MENVINRKWCIKRMKRLLAAFCCTSQLFSAFNHLGLWDPAPFSWGCSWDFCGSCGGSQHKLCRTFPTVLMQIVMFSHPKNGDCPAERAALSPGAKPCWTQSCAGSGWVDGRAGVSRACRVPFLAQCFCLCCLCVGQKCFHRETQQRRVSLVELWLWNSSETSL